MSREGERGSGAEKGGVGEEREIKKAGGMGVDKKRREKKRGKMRARVWGRERERVEGGSGKER